MLVSRYLVNATGLLVIPKMPDIKGIDDFEGKLIHTARWDYDTDLTDKRVAVIGTGATAIQVIPAIADQVKQLDIYQRTAIWLLPKLNPQLSSRLEARAGHGALPADARPLAHEPLRRGRPRDGLGPLPPLPLDLRPHREEARRLHPTRGPRPRDPGEADPALQLLLQASRASRTSSIPASTAERRARHRADRARDGERHRGGGRHGARGRRARLRHGLQRLQSQVHAGLRGDRTQTV